MSLFKSKKNQAPQANNNQLQFAELALRTIQEGVIMANRAGVIQFINPAAVTMTSCKTPENAYGLDYGLLLRIETKEGRELSELENPLIQAVRNSQPLGSYECCLISGLENKRTPIAISVLPVAGGNIITFRDITRELAEEGEQTEFISTASHEMRTPVASIEGYLSLALNPQTATIDDRARGYLDSAHAAAEHLGKLFRDLLDTTGLDDGHIRPQFVPVEMVGTVKQIADDFIVRMREAKLNYRFGSADPVETGGALKLNQVVYGSVDLNFLREILGNLLDNALKYTPAGGSVYVGVLGDGDRVLINVTDTGLGISSGDLQHIFQKFYRADNSDTREIGGTGLGLYITKQRVEAMGGRIWAESAFGEGTTFFVSLPRISGEEYEKRMIAIRNAAPQLQPVPASQPQPAVPPAPPSPPTPTPQPTTQPINTN
ncbi:MAG: ATP-binding protein [Candidatus Saccharibacteria bacterium]|nr:ATP-binding protein [Candidatus Saccharibacteria bacterium]